MEQLITIDHTIFNFINHQFSNGFFDLIMPLFRNKWLWLPLYIYLLYISYKNFGLKNTLYILVGLIITIIISDALIANSFKHYFQRIRPCHYQTILNQSPITIGNCGSGYSFISAHTTNHFAIAIFFIQIIKKFKLILIIWACSIAFASIYVAAHYPADCLFGAIFGILAGLSVSKLTNYYITWKTSLKNTITEK